MNIPLRNIDAIFIFLAASPPFLFTFILIFAILAALIVAIFSPGAAVFLLGMFATAPVLLLPIFAFFRLGLFGLAFACVLVPRVAMFAAFSRMGILVALARLFLRLWLAALFLCHWSASSETKLYWFE